MAAFCTEEKEDALEVFNTATVLKLHSNRNPESQEQVVHIVGTAHISKKSCDVVKNVIHDVHPDAIFLELCNARSAILTPPKTSKMKEPDLNGSLKLWQEGKVTLFEALYSWMLARFGSEMEIFPGEEFRVAFEEAKRIKARVMLGDRPIHITVKRMWSELSFWEKCRLCWYLVVTGVNIPDKEEIMKLFREWEETDAITEAIRELSATFPSIGVQLIDERNLYMIHNLRELSHQASTIVAVVGAGHLPGIKENWEKEIDIQQIARLPEKKQSHFWRYCLIATSGIAVATIAYLKTRPR